MTNSGYDEKDEDLGCFFEQCAKRTRDVFYDKTSFIEISTDDLNHLSVYEKTELINMSPFIFISFTHGSESELLCAGIRPFISTSLNHNQLRNGFVYCYSCCSGIDLGPKLMGSGALCFVGYSKKLYVQHYFGALTGFVECATEGIYYFFKGESVIKSVKKMKEKYTHYIDKYYSEDPFLAGLFLENRDAIICYGNLGLKLTDF